MYIHIYIYVVPSFQVTTFSKGKSVQGLYLVSYDKLDDLQIPYYIRIENLTGYSSVNTSNWCWRAYLVDPFLFHSFFKKNCCWKNVYLINSSIRPDVCFDWSIQTTKLFCYELSKDTWKQRSQLYVSEWVEW